MSAYCGLAGVTGFDGGVTMVPGVCGISGKRVRMVGAAKPGA